jgi:hypothetical protein
MVSKRVTVVEATVVADCCPCVEAASRVTVNCWNQRQCGAVGVHLRWRRQSRARKDGGCECAGEEVRLGRGSQPGEGAEGEAHTAMKKLRIVRLGFGTW